MCDRGCSSMSTKPVSNYLFIHRLCYFPVQLKGRYVEFRCQNQRQESEKKLLSQPLGVELVENTYEDEMKWSLFRPSPGPAAPPSGCGSGRCGRTC